MRSGFPRVVNGVVNAVCLSRLGRTWIRGKSEVSITTGLPQHVQLVVDSTPPAVRAGVVQCPIAVNKPIANLTRGVAGEKPMPLVQTPCTVQQCLPKLRRRVVVVMKV